MYLPIIIAGFLGGVTRGLVGFVKHQYSYKKVPFDLKYFFSMMLLSGLIGFVCSLAVKEAGLLISFSPALSFITGYAGGDFLENLYKIIIKKSSIYKNGE